MSLKNALIVIVIFYIGFKYGPYSWQSTTENTDVPIQPATVEERGPFPSTVPDSGSIIKYEKVKMNMQRYFNALEDRNQNTATVRSSSVMKGRDHAPSKSAELYHIIAKSTASSDVSAFNGAEKAELPIINQNMCGSCWAISCSMALKANLDLKSHGMHKDAVPNLNYLIACSHRPHQIVNTRNSEDKWIIELSNTRSVHAGCEGGITGMGLAMLQLEKEVYVDDVNQYQSGTVGDLSPGPVGTETMLNLPDASCSEARASAKKNILSVPFSLKDVDTLHLFRRSPSYRVYMPSTRDVREFVYTYSAVIVFVDMDSGLQTTDLYGETDVVHLPECNWKRSDFVQSDKDDMHSISQFKEADHAMLLVGWSCERKAWLLQNSWGKEWGNNGRLWVYDANVCNDNFDHSAHSYGAGPACMFGSTISAFTMSTKRDYRL